MMNQKDLLFVEGKRKYLFCGDSEGVEDLYNMVQQAIENQSPFDFHLIEDETDSFLTLWLSQQKMGAYLYIAGQLDFVKRVEKIAYEFGFSEQEIQVKVIGPIKKKLVCCKCHGFNEIEAELMIICSKCGIELEVSDHYSRRLDAYLGYISIK
jgi:dimethylamine monooxygenase subunit C